MSKFYIEDDDIVRLDTRNPEQDPQRAGWVNVGAFAVCISLDETADLKVEVYPCGNEGDYPLVHCSASKGWAMSEGAKDMDA